MRADPAIDTSTPGDVSLTEPEDEMGRLERVSCLECRCCNTDISSQLVKDYERGDLAKIDWLDRLAFRQLEQTHAVSR